MAEFESPLLTPSSSDLVEIWGDTVDVGHLRKAIAIGAVISLSLFWVARQVGHGAQGAIFRRQLRQGLPLPGRIIHAFRQDAFRWKQDGA